MTYPGLSMWNGSSKIQYLMIFCHSCCRRLWRPWMVLSTKSNGHKSNVRISWMYRSCFYDLKVHFWWSNKCLLSRISSLNTLYFKNLTIHLYHSTSQHSECKKLGGNDPSGCHHPLGFCCSAQHCRLPQLSRLSSLSQMGIFWMDEVIEAVMGHSLQSMLQWAIELATQLLEGLRGQKIKLIYVVYQPGPWLVRFLRSGKNPHERNLQHLCH